MEMFEEAFRAVKARSANGNNEDKLLWFKLKAKLFERLLMKQITEPLMPIIHEAHEFCKPVSTSDVTQPSVLNPS